MIEKKSWVAHKKCEDLVHFWMVGSFPVWKLPRQWRQSTPMTNQKSLPLPRGDVLNQSEVYHCPMETVFTNDALEESEKFCYCSHGDQCFAQGPLNLSEQSCHYLCRYNCKKTLHVLAPNFSFRDSFHTGASNPITSTCCSCISPAGTVFALSSCAKTVQVVALNQGGRIVSLLQEHSSH